jgi:hypothetical protein
MDAIEEHVRATISYLASVCKDTIPADAISEILENREIVPVAAYQSIGHIVLPSYIALRVMRALLAPQVRPLPFIDSFELQQIRRRRAALYFRLLSGIQRSTAAELEADANHSALTGNWIDYLRHRYWWRVCGWYYLVALRAHGLEYKLGRSPDIHLLAADLSELLAACEHPPQ